MKLAFLAGAHPTVSLGIGFALEPAKAGEARGTLIISCLFFHVRIPLSRSPHV